MNKRGEEITKTYFKGLLIIIKKIIWFLFGNKDEYKNDNK